MKKVLVFENTEYAGNLEKEFYHFCLLRQLSLAGCFFCNMLYSFLRFWGFIPRRKYLEKRLRFINKVKNLDGKIDSFWNTRRKHMAHISSGGNTCWISEYPALLLENLARNRNAELYANSYDAGAGNFTCYHDIHSLCMKATGGKKAVIYDKYRSVLKDNKNVVFKTVYNRKTFDSIKEYRRYKTLYTTFTCFILLAMGICLGLVSLYFGAAYFLMPMFLSYFRIPGLVFLNIFPVVFFMFLFYLIFNRVWASFTVTSVLMLVLTWINYFKLLIRNDPLLAADIVLVSEAMNMTGQFSIQLNWKIVCSIIACILGIAFGAVAVRQKIRNSRFRLAGIVVLVLIGVYSFNSIYMNPHVYSDTENYALINRWSATQVYISRGFAYPFIYSIKSCVDKPPEGYDKKEAEEILFSHEYSNIEEDRKVNIISIMLESYNDFSKFESLEFNTDVYEYWHQLQEESFSGELVTNIFVGGTVNTERCFLTGYTSLFNFRANVNSYAHYFKEQGYFTGGSHPCYGWFYNRQNVNKYLGFDEYYFYENMYSELSGGKIAGDEILFPQIIRLYEESKTKNLPYFGYNLTYQNHGPYSTERKADMDYVKNKGYTGEEFNILNNYLAGIYSTNTQLEPFIDYFRNDEEPVVIILFGDHNPWLGDNNSVYHAADINLDLSTEEGFYNYYNTPYIIWANENAKKVLGNDFVGSGPSIGPYFLMNVFFDLAGYEGNEYMKYSNNLRNQLDIIHYNRYYREDGVLTTDLSPKAKQMLDEFSKVQHYWRNNFRE